MPGEKLIQAANIWLSCTKYAISAGLLWWISLVHRSRGLLFCKIEFFDMRPPSKYDSTIVNTKYQRKNKFRIGQPPCTWPLKVSMSSLPNSAGLQYKQY